RPPAETPTLPPSSIMVGIETALRTARDGILLAVRPGPLSVASAKEVFDSAPETVRAPRAGAAAGLGQLAENTPGVGGLLRSEFLAGGINGPAFTLRHLAMGAPDVKTLKPEEVEALSAPMSGREALELALQMAPLAVGGAKKGIAAVRQELPTLLSERGSIGRGGAGESKGVKTPGEVPPPEAPSPEAPPAAAPPRTIPVPPALGGDVPPTPATPAINPRTLGTPEHVSQAISELDAYVTERLAKHRATKTHAQTVAGADMPLKKALAVTPETAYLSEEEMVAMRAHFEHAAEWYETVRRRYVAGNVTPEQLDAAWAVAFTLAGNDVAAGTNASRTLNIRAAAIKARALAGKSTPEQILAAGEKLLGRLPGDAKARADALAHMTAGLGAAQRRAWFRTLWAGFRAGRDFTHQLWINNILSGVETQYKNVFGTTL